MSDLRTLLASCGRVENVSIAWRPPASAPRPGAPPLSSPGGLGGGGGGGGVRPPRSTASVCITKSTQHAPAKSSSMSA